MLTGEACNLTLQMAGQQTKPRSNDIEVDTSETRTSHTSHVSRPGLTVTGNVFELKVVTQRQAPVLPNPAPKDDIRRKAGDAPISQTETEMVTSCYQAIQSDAEFLESAADSIHESEKFTQSSNQSAGQSEDPSQEQIYQMWEDNKVPYLSAECSSGSILQHLKLRLEAEEATHSIEIGNKAKERITPKVVGRLSWTYRLARESGIPLSLDWQIQSCII